MALIQKAISKNPNNAAAYYYRGLIYNDQSKTEDAIQNYREAIGRQADFKDASYGLGVALETKKDFLGAKEAFEKFVQLSGATNDEFTKYARERLAEL